MRKISEWNDDDLLLKLRKEAEKLVSEREDLSVIKLTEFQVKKLLHEVQIQQVELEMQNDELKISNEELAKQRSKFADFYDLAPVGYFVISPLGLIEEVNTTGTNLLRTSKSVILSKRFQSFLATAELESFYIFLQTILHSNTKYSCSLQMVTYKKEYFYAQLEGLSVQTAYGKSCYLAVIDITEKRKAEMSLLDTKERLEMALRTSAAGTWEIDPKTGKITLDEFSSVLLGLKAPKFDGHASSFLKPIHTDDRAAVDKAIQKALVSNSELDIEFRVTKAKHKIHFIAARGYVVHLQNEKDIFVGTLIDRTERKLLEQEAAELKANQDRKILSAVLQTEERERKRISEALHDSVSQLLYGIQLELQNLPTEHARVGDSIKSLLGEAIAETRNISFALAPAILADFGLKVTLEEMASRLSTNKLLIETSIKGYHRQLNVEFETSIFRIIQELLNNCLKHASASHVKIEVIKLHESLLITVSDNGKGFDPQVAHVSGSGISSVKNRVNILNGVMNIESEANRGTAVKLMIKLN